MGELNLTKRRAVDLCRVATCLCRMSWPRGRPHLRDQASPTLPRPSL